MALERPQHEQVAPDLHDDIGQRERQARSSNARGIEHDITSPASISANSISRTAGRRGSNQLVNQAVSIQAHQTRDHQQGGLHRAERREMLEQAVRELRDREHEHQVEEQLDVSDPVVLVSVPHPKVTCQLAANIGVTNRSWTLLPSTLVYLIASGLTGEPTAPVIGIAGATNRNS